MDLYIHLDKLADTDAFRQCGAERTHCHAPSPQSPATDHQRGSRVGEEEGAAPAECPGEQPGSQSQNEHDGSRRREARLIEMPSQSA
jgi:hypothetical protein